MGGAVYLIRVIIAPAEEGRIRLNCRIRELA
jgi:hypothetical protein